MSQYKVRVYEATGWSLFTQADHFQDYHFESTESLEQIAKRLGRDGFPAHGGKKWIMPAAILTIEIG